MVTFSHHYNWSISLELAKSPLNSIEIRFGIWKSNQSGIDFSCVRIEFNLIYRHITICIEWDQLEFQKRYSVLFIHLEYIYLTVCSFWIVEYSDRFSVRFRFESGSFFPKFFDAIEHFVCIGFVLFPFLPLSRVLHVSCTILTYKLAVIFESIMQLSLLRFRKHIEWKYVHDTTIHNNTVASAPFVSPIPYICIQTKFPILLLVLRRR